MTLVQTSPKHIYMAKEENISDTQGPCPSGFHVPLQSEWVAVYDIGVNLGIWSSSNGDGMKTYLKMPYAGYIDYNASSLNRGYYCYYWSSIRYNTGFSDCLKLFPSSVDTQEVNYLTYGLPIRAFKDTPIIPDSSWTALYSDKIYWNSDLGLISISGDGSTWYTIADKNLGATVVYNSGDTLNDNNCGKYYQRGNNYGFTYNSVSSTTTRVDASAYGPGNYYSSSTFIKYNGGWDTTDNYNLRGGVSYAGGDTDIKAVYLGETKVRPAYKPRTFTITRTEKSDMSSGWTYSDDATGLTAGDGAFDDFFGYSAVLLNTSGVETAEMTQSGGVFTGAMSTLGNITSGDNVMIKFPVRGIKMTKSGSTVTLSITEELEKDGYQYYAHTKGSDIKDALYLGAYKMTSGYTSRSGAYPTSDLTRASFRSGVKSTYDSSAGTNRYSQITIYPRWYINALYMMKYGSPNSQSVVGQGYVGAGYYGGKQTTGGTNSQTNATYGNPNNSTRVRLFGLEDRWGNVTEFIDGCWVNSSQGLTVDKTNSVFQDSNYSTNLGTFSGNGRMTSIKGTNDGMFFISAGGGSGTTYYTDGFVMNASCVLIAGGYWDSGYNSQAGALYMYAASSSSSYSSYCSRLQYL